MKYVYFISYDYTEGVGNIDLISDSEYTTINHIRDAERVINEKTGEPWVIVNNFILLRTEE